MTGLAVQGQGLVNFNNRVVGSIVAPVYGVDSLFSGPLLSGSGHTAGLWGGSLGSTEDALVLLGTTTFQSNVWAGYVVPVQLPCPIVLPGQRATFQVRAWDNQGGTVTNWNQARSGDFGAYGSSALFSPPDALGANPLNLVGLGSFNLVGPKSLTNFLADCAPASRSTIAWFDSPPLFIGFSVTTLDLDRDAVSDISVWSDWPQCTASIPSECSAPHYVAALGTNSLLAEGSEVFLRPPGFSIGGVTASNAAWSNPGQRLDLTTIWSSLSISGWTPPLGLWGDGYAGVRFHSADGWHYGWLHLQFHPWLLAIPWPAVTEWAYETRPDVAICAGAKPVLRPLAAPEMVGATHLRLHWASEIGRTYQVQFKDRLDAVRWTNLGSVVIATATDSAIALPLNGSTSFFRIVESE